MLQSEHDYHSDEMKLLDQSKMRTTIESKMRNFVALHAFIVSRSAQYQFTVQLKHLITISGLFICHSISASKYSEFRIYDKYYNVKIRENIERFLVTNLVVLQ